MENNIIKTPVIGNVYAEKKTNKVFIVTPFTIDKVKNNLNDYEFLSGSSKEYDFSSNGQLGMFLLQTIVDAIKIETQKK